MRSFLYLLARWMGNANAVQRGTVGKRVVRRYAYRTTAKALRRLLK